MGKGRAPCCDKSQVKKGPWSPAEDLRLITFIQKHGHENWRALPKQAGLLRCGKSCRLRWINYLRPDVKRGNFSKEEEDSIIKLHQTLGNKWSKIASHLPGRTDNEIKNVWNTHLKKRLTFKEQDSTGGGDESKESSTTSSSSSSSSITIMQTKRRNVESEVDHHHHYRQWKSDHDGSVNKKPRVAEQEAKEMPTSSASSNNSNITNYNNKPEDDQPDYLLDHFSPPYDVHNVLEEVNKPEIQETAAADQAVVDIPFESDLDFWNMLDGLNSSIPMDNNNSNSIDKISSCHSSSLGEVENRKWLRYLENELGLEATKDGSHESTSLSEDDAAKPIVVTENFHYEIPVKPPEVNSGMGYYHLWPSVA